MRRAYRMAWAIASVLVSVASPVWAAGAEVGKGYRFVDLRPVVNMGFKDSVKGDGKGGWTDSGGDDLRFVPVGQQTFRGIPFDVIDPKANRGKSCLILGGTRRPNFPLEATVSDINRKAKSIVFLHTHMWYAQKVATYTVMYADGTNEAIDIKSRQHIGDWWQPKDQELCRVAWHGPNLYNGSVGVYLYAWTNPHPDKTIKSIRFAKPGDVKAVLAVLAVTLADHVVKLPPREKEEDAKPEGQDLEFQAGQAATIGMKIIGPIRQEDILPIVQPEENGYIPAKLKHNFTYMRGDYGSNNPEKLPMGGFADVSFLNDKPAGEHGYLKVVNGHLQFDDNTPARFLCTNLTYGIIFPKDRERAKLHAQWLAANGINWVRFHHFTFSGKDDLALFDFWEDLPKEQRKAAGRTSRRWRNTRRYDMECWDKMDMLLAEMRNEGIYAHISAVTFPWFGDIEAVEKNIPPRGNGYHAYRMEGAQIFIKEYIDKLKGFWKDFLQHTNPHTGKRYVDDPTVASIELLNEDSIMWRGCDPSRLSGFYYMELHERWNNWLLEKYGSMEKLRVAWGPDVMEDWERPLKDINFMKQGRAIPEPPRFDAAPTGFRPVDLASAVNTTYTDQYRNDGKGGWTDNGKDEDMRFFPTGPRLLLDVPFNIPAKGPVLIADKASFKDVGRGKGKRPDPRKQNPWVNCVSLPATGKAKCVYFLHTAGWMPKGNKPVFQYDVVYADGSRETIPVHNGREISDWTRPTNAGDMRAAWQGMSLGQDTIGLALFAWDNPHPDKAIAKIEARIQGNAAIVNIVGLTLSDKPKQLPSIADTPSMPAWKRFVRLWPYKSRFVKEGWNEQLLRRASDQLQFLYDLQTGYYLSMKKYLRGLGFKGLVLGSAWKCPPLMNPVDIYSNAQLDVLDRHNYGGSIGFMRAPGDGTMTSGPVRVFGKPIMISEYYPRRNEPYQFCVFPLISLYGQCLNGWEFPSKFPCRRFGWGFYEHWDCGINYPSDLVQFPAMALAVRRQDLKPGPVVYRRQMSKEEIFAKKVDVEHVYDNKYFAIGKVGTDYVDTVRPDVVDKATIQTCLDENKKVVRSATGELEWDYGKGIAVCRAGRTQGAIGFLMRSKAIELPAAKVRIDTPFAAIWLSSLDGKDIKDAQKILVTLTARNSAPKDKKGKPQTYHPVIVEGVSGRVVLQSSLADKLRVYALDWDGRAVRPIKTKLNGSELSFDFDTMNWKGPYIAITTKALEIKRQ